MRKYQRQVAAIAGRMIRRGVLADEVTVALAAGLAHALEIVPPAQAGIVLDALDLHAALIEERVRREAK